MGEIGVCEKMVYICERMINPDLRLAREIKPGAGMCARCEYDSENNPNCTGYIRTEVPLRVVEELTRQQNARFR